LYLSARGATLRSVSKQYLFEGTNEKKIRLRGKLEMLFRLSWRVESDDAYFLSPPMAKIRTRARTVDMLDRQ
jgi:hypothetical protein